MVVMIGAIILIFGVIGLAMWVLEAGKEPTPIGVLICLLLLTAVSFISYAASQANHTSREWKEPVTKPAIVIPVLYPYCTTAEKPEISNQSHFLK